MSIRQRYFGHHLYKNRDFLFSETKLDNDIQMPENIKDDVKEWQSIFLTGPTGFMGSFLLKEILESTSCVVFCLVRADDVEKGMVRVKGSLSRYGLWNESYSDRIKIITGDLSKKQFGLSRTLFEKMAQVIDTIFHFGASINWLSSYDKGASTNVNGIKEILRLASLIKKKTINYSSSMGAFASLRYPLNKTIYEDEYLHEPESLYGGYCQAKWVCERILVEGRNRGIPSNIFRFGDVKGDSVSGISDLNNFGNTLMRVCIYKQKAPIVRFRTNFLPINYLTKAVIKIAQMNKGIGNNYQFNNPQKSYWEQVVDEINRNGCKVDMIPLEDWLEILDEKPRTDETRRIKPIFKKLNITEETQDVSLFDIGTHLYLLDHNTDNTDSILKTSNIKCARFIEDGALKNYISYFKSYGNRERGNRG